MIFRISINEVELIAHRMAQRIMTWDEPIPDFSTRFPNVLESCLSAPFQTYDKRNLYHGLSAQGAILFYLMVKNHPFQNGNKRVAVTTLFFFLSKNGKWLKVGNEELYNFSVWVAASPAEFKDEVVTAIEKFIRKNLIDNC